MQIQDNLSGTEKNFCMSGPSNQAIKMGQEPSDRLAGHHERCAPGQNNEPLINVGQFFYDRW
jgi:hypothetical protein